MLDNQRENINSIDKRIIQLLEERFDICQEIGLIKAKNNLPVFDPSREKNVLTKIEKLSKKYPKQNIAVFKSIMQEAKNIE